MQPFISHIFQKRRPIAPRQNFRCFLSSEVLRKDQGTEDGRDSKSTGRYAGRITCFARGILQTVKYFLFFLVASTINHAFMSQFCHGALLIWRLHKEAHLMISFWPIIFALLNFLENFEEVKEHSSYITINFDHLGFSTDVKNWILIC